MAIIGIDLGTTNSVVSVYEKGRNRIIPINGSTRTPSVIWIKPNGDCVVGREAKQHVAFEPDRILISTKRDLGSFTTYQIGEETFTPTEAMTIILFYLKREATKTLNEEVNDVVITVPACFGNNEIDEVKKAAIDAGMNPIAIITESVAALVDYLSETKIHKQIVCIINIGGKFCDISIGALGYDKINTKRRVELFKVSGDLDLGGDDFDNVIIDWMILNGAKGYKNKLELKPIAESAKIELASLLETQVSHPVYMPNEVVLTRDNYKKLIQNKLDQIGDTIKRTVEECIIDGEHIDMDDINRFVLVGGSCKHPVVHDYIIESIEREPFFSSNLDFCVACGAAKYLYSCKSSDVCIMMENSPILSPLQDNVLELKYKEYIQFLEDLQKNEYDVNFCVFEQEDTSAIDWEKVFCCLDKLHMNSEYVLDDYRSLFSDNNILSLYARLRSVNRPYEEDWIRWEYNNIPHVSFHQHTFAFSADINDERKEYFRIPYSYEELTDEQKNILKERVKMPPQIDPLLVITLEKSPDAIWQAFLLHITYMFTGYRWHGGYVHKNLICSRKALLEINPGLSFLQIDDNLFVPRIIFDEGNPNIGHIECCWWSEWGGLFTVIVNFKYSIEESTIKFSDIQSTNIFEYNSNIVY